VGSTLPLITPRGIREKPNTRISTSRTGVPGEQIMYLGIDVHKRYAQVAVMDEVALVSVEYTV